MQQVLNSKDRNQAFLKFLFFFVLSAVLLVSAIYFDFRMPIRENRMLLDELDRNRQIESNEEKFVATMQEAVTLIDSLDKPGANTGLINVQLNEKLSELSALQLKDNSTYGKMNRAIVDKFIVLQEAKGRLLNLAEKENKISSMEAELNETKAQLLQTQTDLDAYRRAGNR